MVRCGPSHCGLVVVNDSDSPVFGPRISCYWVHHFGSDGIYHSVLHSYSYPLVVFVVVEVEVVIEVEVEVGVDVWMDLVASVEFISGSIGTGGIGCC